MNLTGWLCASVLLCLIIDIHIHTRRYVSMLENFHTSFNHLVSDFMASLQDETHSEYHLHLSNLCTRLDFNEFYATGS